MPVKSARLTQGKFYHHYSYDHRPLQLLPVWSIGPNCLRGISVPPAAVATLSPDRPSEYSTVIPLVVYPQSSKYYKK